MTTGASYQILSSGTVAEIHGTVIGHHNDGNGNVTVVLVESTDQVTFPDAGHVVKNGDGCTLTATGNLACASVNGKDIWSAMADGIVGGPSSTEPRAIDWLAGG